MWKTLCKMDREKSSHSIRQFPLTSTQLNYIFILQEHKLNFSGKRGPMTSASLSMLISCRGAKGKRKQQTVNNERSWKTRGKHRSKEGRRSRWLRKETCGNWGERKQLARRGLNAKFMKDLEDTGDLDGMWVSCFLPKYHTNKGNQRNLQRHRGSRKGLEKERWHIAFRRSYLSAWGMGSVK